MSFTTILEDKYPRAWKYFKDFYDNDYEDKQMPFEDFSSLPFDYQIGVYLQFFDTINGDIQLYATDRNALKDAVEEAFGTYQEYLFLDS